ncbi:hypothetical protein [Haladaptatus salinisoli]|uniref:hypothetical protein n=1 Tax=Haladaptatus salinisoli TaxID=2884876 RepID=UPI001D0BC0D8|nr:hypothetical protein [Haladaptatus salinisoli]
MTRYAFTADSEHEEIIEHEEDTGNHDSTASAIRACIARSAELQQECDELEAHVEELQRERDERVAELQQTVERLEREKRMIIEQRDETETLQRYVEEEQTFRRASLGTRLRWWIFGMDD